jgi:nucleotide-binding universal stress UspA family protein
MAEHGTITAWKSTPIARPVDGRRTRVVVGNDGSRLGRLALRWAADHAWRAGAMLDVHTAPNYQAGGGAGEQDWLSNLAAEFPSLPVVARYSTNATDTLIKASADADLVVLGRQGHEHAGLGLGAAVRPVAEYARCDVVVVGGRLAAINGTNDWVSVLLGSSADERALHRAGRLAALRRVPLRIIYGKAWVDPQADVGPVDRYLAVLHSAAELVQRLEPSVPTVTELVWADPCTALARPTDTDVLVVGVCDRLDALAIAALERAESPVLLARTTFAHPVTPPKTRTT